MWSRRAKGSTIFLGIVILVFFLWNYLAPENNDDLDYKFLFVQHMELKKDFTHPISSFYDIFVSQWNHYFVMNGRTFIHILLQTFTSLLGKHVFNVFNTLVFGVFLILVSKYIGKTGHLFYTLTTVILLLLLPAFSETFIWMAGAINYLWPSAAVLLLLLYYDAHKDEKASYPGFLLPLLGAFCTGWTHEGITFPLATGLFFFSCYKKDISFRRKGFPLIILFGVGMLFCILSPGLFMRAEGHEWSLKSLIIFLLTCLTRLRLFYVMLLFMYLMKKKHPNEWLTFLKDKGYLILASFAALLPVFAAKAAYGRVLYGTEFYAFLVILLLLPKLVHLSERTETKVSAVLSALLAVFAWGVSIHAAKNYEEAGKITHHLKLKERIIKISDYRPSFWDNYIVQVSFYPLPDSNGKGHVIWALDEPRELKAIYGYKDELYFVPEPIVRKMETEDASLNEFDLSPQQFLYVKRLPREAKVKGIRVLLHPTDFSDLPFWFRPLARHYGKYTYREYVERNFSVVPYGKYNYVIVRRNDLLKERVKHIEVECEESRNIDDNKRH